MGEAPVHEMSRECANVLARAADSGSSVTESALQEELGVGHGDLRGILDQLREAGRATEVAPGEWSGPDAEEAEPVRVRTSDPDDGPLPVEGPVGPAVEVFGGRVDEPTVRLTATVADALDAESLGKLVKAGIEEAREVGSVFLLEVGTR